MAIGNPSPLGLAAFALTTFVLSCYNAGIFGVQASDPVNVITGLAFFYGGIAQILAGMWELAIGNTFAATAFTSYGAFWLSFATILIPSFGIVDGYKNSSDATFVNASAIYLLAWTIFTLILLLASLRTTVGLVCLFTALTATFSLLTAAEFGSANQAGVGSFTKVHRAAGFLGIVTAVIAWYNALAGLLESQRDAVVRLPVGKLLRRNVVGSASPAGGTSKGRN